MKLNTILNVTVFNRYHRIDIRGINSCIVKLGSRIITNRSKQVFSLIEEYHYSTMVSLNNCNGVDGLSNNAICASLDPDKNPLLSTSLMLYHLACDTYNQQNHSCPNYNYE